MDDIARDPHVDAQVVPAEASRLRLKGPVSEFAIDETVDGSDEASDRLELADRLGVERSPTGPRLPRVTPLAPIDDADDDDLLGSPDVEPATDEVASALPEDEGSEDDGKDAAAPDDPHPSDGAPDEGASEDLPAAEAAAREPDSAGNSEGELPTAAEPITDPQKLVRVVFGLLLTNRDGLSPLRLAQVCETTQEAVRAALETLRQELAATQAPLELTQSGESWKLWTTPEVFPYLETLRGIKKHERLSPAALETLAVIAYRQPVFRAEIEAIRGVKVGPMLRTLLDCKLVRIVGRADVPGRPLQYGTTQFFLERFGLSALTDLPSVKEFKGLGG